MELTLDNVLQYTRFIIYEYYQLNAEPLFSILEQNTIWIGPSDLFVFGSTAIRNCLEQGVLMPAMSMKKDEFYLLDKNENGCVVIGQYMLYNTKKSSEISTIHQRVTFYYKKVKNKLYLIHIHISNEWNKVVGNKIFSEKVSKQTHQSLYNITEKKERKIEEEKIKNKKITLKTDMGIEFINPKLVIYVEAIGPYCIINFMNKSITVRKLLHDIVSLFPSYFYRFHRSYFVNCSYITKIERYSITLVTGMCLPIPEKKYNTVRKEIIKIIENK